MGYTYLTQIVLTYLYWRKLSIDVPTYRYFAVKHSLPEIPKIVFLKPQ